MPQQMYDETIQEEARAMARSLLSQSHSFRNMDRSEQLAMYKDMVQAQYKELTEKDDRENRGRLAKQKGLSTGLAASDQINDSRHLNQRIGRETGEMAADFISDVDFPQFVEDLLTGVFDANLNVTVTQMQEYQKLLKSATKSLSSFVKKVSDEDAFAYLADNMGDQFSFIEDEQGQPALGGPNGQALDIGDNEVKARVMDAKLALAQEQRALLRETILMGISRLVVERGTVKAAVVFDVKAAEKIDKSDRAADSSTTKSGSTSGGGFWGFYSRRGSSTNKRSKISVSSAKSTATTDLAAQITGSVELVFKSDYFKLDNFASMYGGQPPQNQGQGQPAGQPPQPGQFLPG
ncbi:MAG: hypothetical protein QNJ46_05805 [Leptolyngbyaceae cyanobacterium MO_188.B28]|nr:hypothetical protein [Leptolyngbyaceae cyanobacterium MO_188.B28]